MTKVQPAPAGEGQRRHPSLAHRQRRNIARLTLPFLRGSRRMGISGMQCLPLPQPQLQHNNKMPVAALWRRLSSSGRGRGEKKPG